MSIPVHIEPFIDALEHLYESVLISKAIVVCLNDEAVQETLQLLESRAFPAIALTHAHFNNGDAIKRLYQFKRTPNLIMVVPMTLLQSSSSSPLDDGWFHAYIMQTPWNALIGHHVPTYHLEPILQRAMKAHQRGFWHQPDPNRFYWMWYLE